MVLPQTNRAGAVRVAERIRAAVAGAALPHAASPVCDRVTVSVGVACMTPQPHGPQMRGHSSKRRTGSFIWPNTWGETR